MRAHRPSETNRAKVIALVTNGARQDRIAEHLEIGAKTLHKHYAKELAFGTENLLSRVLNNLASIACRGRGMPAVSAAKYLLSCRGGYKEHSSLEIESGEGLSGLMRQCGVDAAADLRARILARIAAQNGPPEDNAREFIAGKLAKLAARNAEIADRSESRQEPARGRMTTALSIFTRYVVGSWCRLPLSRVVSGAIGAATFGVDSSTCEPKGGLPLSWRRPKLERATAQPRASAVAAKATRAHIVRSAKTQGVAMCNSSCRDRRRPPAWIIRHIRPAFRSRREPEP